MKTSRMMFTVAASVSAASLALGQAQIRAMNDNRSGNISVLANAPSGDPREAGYNVDAGQNEFEPFNYNLIEFDVRSGCPGTSAQAITDHSSDFIGINGQMICRGFRATHSADSNVTVTSCGAGQNTFANFESNFNVVLRIENAPAGGTPIRIRGTAGASGGTSVQVRILRPNGTALLNLQSSSVNSVVNLTNGDYTIQGSSSSGMVSRSTIGSSAKACDYSVGFWRECDGDLTGDGQVGLDDLSLLLTHFGGGNQGDLDGNGLTNLADLARLLARFGATCS